MTLTEAKSEAAEKDEEIARLKKLQHRLADDTVEFYGYRYWKRTDGKGPAAGNPFCDVGIAGCRDRVESRTSARRVSPVRGCRVIARGYREGCRMVVVADKGWTPSRYGVSSSSQVVDGELSGISIRHHMFPFRGELEVSGQSFDDLSLQKLALKYLSEVERRGYVNLPRQWLDAL